MGEIINVTLVVLFIMILLSCLLPMILRKYRHASDDLGGKMNENTEYLLSSEHTLKIAREVITKAYNQKDERPSSKAILAFATRIASTWKSIDTLIEHNQEKYAFQAVTSDCETLQRCMYDAYLQMRWIAEGPNDPDEMGQLYIDFIPVELFKLVECKLRLKDVASKRLANSPLKEQGHPRLENEYNAVKHKYPKGNGRGVRNQWYEGGLDKIAEDLNLSSEYSWMVRINNSSVHTGPSAMFRPSSLAQNTIQHIVTSIMMYGMKILMDHYGLNLSDTTTQVVDEYTKHPLMRIEQF